jgi:Domain of unknown function (DUF4267)
MGSRQRDKVKDAVAISRIAVGAGTWLTPNLSGRMFGLDPEGNPQLPYVGRLFGARDVALGAGVLRSSRKQKDAWLTAGLACDVADVAAGAIAGARGTLPPAAAALVTATAAGFAAFGYWLLQQ